MQKIRSWYMFYTTKFYFNNLLISWWIYIYNLIKNVHSFFYINIMVREFFIFPWSEIFIVVWSDWLQKSVNNGNQLIFNAWTRTRRKEKNEVLSFWKSVVKGREICELRVCLSGVALLWKYLYYRNRFTNARLCGKAEIFADRMKPKVSRMPLLWIELGRFVVKEQSCRRNFTTYVVALLHRKPSLTDMKDW